MGYGCHNDAVGLGHSHGGFGSKGSATEEVRVNLGNFRYLRYRGPNGSYGNVAEIEFHRNGVKVTGTGYGTPGSWNGNGNTLSDGPRWQCSNSIRRTDG